MKTTRNIPRLSIEITTEQKKALDKYFNFGEKKTIFGILIDDLILMLEKNPRAVKMGILLRKMRLDNIINLPRK